jgi:lycopene cyclase domain-containing protein
VTYALLNVPFLLLAVAVLGVARARTARPAWPALVVTAAVLLLLTAVFDNLMILAGLVAYDDTQRLGLQIGVAPIEDFAYTVLAVLMLPALWCLLGRRERS